MQVRAPGRYSDAANHYSSGDNMNASANPSETPKDQNDGMPTRRTITKTLAWTVPVIAATVAAPLAAASGATWDLSPEFIGSQGFERTEGNRHVVGTDFPTTLRLRSLDPSGGPVPIGSQVIFTFDVTVVTARVPGVAAMPAGLTRSALVDEDSGLINGYIFTFTKELPSGSYLDIPITAAPGAGQSELGNRQGTLSATALTSADSDPANNIASRIGHATVTVTAT